MMKCNNLQTLWNVYRDLEEYYFEEEKSNFSDFICHWQKRLQSAVEAGLEYPDTLITFKLLRSCRMGREELNWMLNQLQDGSNTDALLQQALDRLDAVKVEVEVDEEECGDEHVDKKDYLLDKDCPEMSDDSPREDDDIFERCSKSRENCKKCGKSFDTKENLLLHIHPNSESMCQTPKKVSGEIHQEYPCVICSKVFTSTKALNRHMKGLFHGGTGHKADSTKETGRSRIHQCDQCGKEFEYRQSFVQHLKIHCAFRCSACKQVFDSKEELQRHAENHEIFSCDQCGKIFTRMAYLKKHFKTIKHDIIDLDCKTCNRRFKTPLGLEKHQTIHEGERLKCTYENCDATFQTRGYLTKHLRTHTKPFKCDQCEKSFGSSSVLRVHKMRHAGIKNHKCDECDKTFIDQFQLKRHMTSHTGEKPFKCSYCPQAFTQKHQCRKHEDRHAKQIEQQL